LIFLNQKLHFLVVNPWYRYIFLSADTGKDSIYTGGKLDKRHCQLNEKIVTPKENQSSKEVLLKPLQENESKQLPTNQNPLLFIRLLKIG
jgi:hypothetical protein